MRVTITGPRSVGKSTIAKLLAKKLNLKYCSSDEIGERAMRKHGGLDKAIKSGVIKKFIKKSGYSLIRKIYKKNAFVFDLSGGAVSSTDFPQASENVRKVAKQRSLVIGLLPAKSSRESVALLFQRETKRRHFKHLDKGEVLKKTKKHFRKFPPLFKRFCDFVIYTGNRTPEAIVNEILSRVKRENNAIRGIIFDIGSTLTRNHWRKRIKAVERETGVPLLEDPTLKNGIALGRTSLKEYLKRSLKKSNSKCTLKMLVTNYKKNYLKYAPLDKNMEHLIKRLKKHYRVYAFSNTNDVHAQVNRKRGLFKKFHKVFLSCEVGLRKPQKEAFIYVLRKLKLPARSLIFIDDDKRNIETALKIGMIAIRYTNYQKLIPRLKRARVVA